LSAGPVGGGELGARLGDRDLSAAPAVLNLVESRSPGAREQTEALLAAVSPAALGAEAPAHIVGVTGPPGVGKSSLLSRLVTEWRAHRRSVALLGGRPDFASVREPCSVTARGSRSIHPTGPCSTSL
jgi:GTPase